MTVIICGGGESIKQEWKNGLFDKIKGKEIWSLNSAFKTMPYLPSRQLFVDKSFFEKNEKELENLWKNNVPITARTHIPYASLKDQIELFNVTKEKHEYLGKQAIEKRRLYAGQDGLCGTFALSYAIAKGYTKIYLLGYDFGTPSPEIKSTHYYQDEVKNLNIRSSGVGHPEKYRNPHGRIRLSVNDYDIFLKDKDVQIFNVSLISNITSFPKISYEEFYDKLNA